MTAVASATYHVIPWTRAAFRKGQRVVNTRSVWAYQAGFTEGVIPVGTTIPEAMVVVVKFGDAIRTAVYDTHVGMKTDYDTRHLALVERLEN
jgi:hypothetical protein